MKIVNFKCMLSITDCVSLRQFGKQDCFSIYLYVLLHFGQSNAFPPYIPRMCWRSVSRQLKFCWHSSHVCFFLSGMVCAFFVWSFSVCLYWNSAPHWEHFSFNSLWWDAKCPRNADMLNCAEQKEHLNRKIFKCLVCAWSCSPRLVLKCLAHCCKECLSGGCRRSWRLTFSLNLEVYVHTAHSYFSCTISKLSSAGLTTNDSFITFEIR